MHTARKQRGLLNVKVSFYIVITGLQNVEKDYVWWL